MGRDRRMGRRWSAPAVLLAGVAAAAIMWPPGAQAATAHVPTLQQLPTGYNDWGIGATMAYDADTGQIMLYGGYSFTDVCGCNGTGGTWVWNGSDFQEVVPAGSSTFYSSLVFDAATHQMLRVGGAMADDTTPVGTTSVWTGSAWQTLSPAHQPSPRLGDVSAYDTRSGQLILFGGGGTSGLSAQTWTWTGADWKLLTPPVSPPARQLASMAYDDATGQIVLYGGRVQTGLLGDTWTWNGTTWKQRTPAHSPGPLVTAAMAYDPALHAVVLFGGRTGVGVISGATWKWTGSDWVPLPNASGPTDVNWPSMAFDPGHGELVLMAPLGDKPAGVAHDLFLIAAPTTTSLTASGGTGGLPVALAVQVAAKDVPAVGGTVTFTRDGGVVPGCSAIPVVSGQASCSRTAPPGTHTFRAVYSAGPGFLPSQSARTVVTVS
jgi:Bacterial Ig-like domain (group 3)